MVFLRSSPMYDVCIGNIIYTVFAGDRSYIHIIILYYFSDVSRENNNNENYNMGELRLLYG